MGTVIPHIYFKRILVFPRVCGLSMDNTTCSQYAYLETSLQLNGVIPCVLQSPMTGLLLLNLISVTMLGKP